MTCTVHLPAAALTALANGDLAQAPPDAALAREHPFSPGGAQWDVEHGLELSGEGKHR